jgi:hypothetical protein
MKTVAKTTLYETEKVSVKSMRNFPKAILFCSLVFLFGCTETEQGTKEVATQNEIISASPQSLLLPKIELVETPKYKELKRRVETQRRKVEELENERQKLTVVYTDLYPPVQKNAKRLAVERKELERLETLLNDEFQKLTFQKNEPEV